MARQREADRRDVVYVATADPLDQEAHRVVSETLGEKARIQWMLAGETEMDLALARHYGRPRNIPEGTKVITGVPVAGPPRTPEADDGSRSTLASTDDIFAALSDGPSEGATTQPDRPVPALELNEADVVGPDDDDGADPLPLSALSSPPTDELLLAEDVVSDERTEVGLPPAVANGSGSLDLDERETVAGRPPVPALTSLVEQPAFTPSQADGLRLDGPAGPSSSPLDGASEFAALRTDDVTDELAKGPITVETPERVVENPPPFAQPSWGDLLTGDAGLPPVEQEDLDIDVTEAHHEEVVSHSVIEALRAAAEALPVADAAMSSGRSQYADGGDLGHPAAPFPPLDDVPEIEEPDDEPRVDLDELVARLAGPASVRPKTGLPLPVPPAEAADALFREIQYFAKGGLVDLSAQQRIVRALAAVMLEKGMLEKGMLESLLFADNAAPGPNADQD